MVRVARVVGLAIWAGIVTSAGAATLDGQGLFLRKCGFCHQFRDLGKPQIGPDLTQRVVGMDPQQIATYIRAPRTVNPSSRMPGQRGLSDHQVESIVQFLTAPTMVPAAADVP
jgi:cytochrome c2